MYECIMHAVYGTNYSVTVETYVVAEPNIHFPFGTKEYLTYILMPFEKDIYHNCVWV